MIAAAPWWRAARASLGCRAELGALGICAPVHNPSTLPSWNVCISEERENSQINPVKKIPPCECAVYTVTLGFGGHFCEQNKKTLHSCDCKAVYYLHYLSLGWAGILHFMHHLKLATVIPQSQ